MNAKSPPARSRFEHHTGGNLAIAAIRPFKEALAVFRGMSLFLQSAPSGDQIEALHEGGESHSRIYIALGDVDSEAVRDENHPDHQQEP